MLTETIALEVAPEIARFYNDASGEDRRKLRLLLGTWMEYYAKADPESLDSIMEDMSLESERNGLTHEVLDSLLEDE